MFHGRANLNLDSKGRLAIPARYHQDLASACERRLVVSAFSRECLQIYPWPVWDALNAKLLSRTNVNPEIRKLQRQLIGHAQDVEMDASGRILISPELRSHAGLDKSVALIGMGSKFELWDPARLDEEIGDPVDFGSIGDELGDVSL